MRPGLSVAAPATVSLVAAIVLSTGVTIGGPVRPDPMNDPELDRRIREGIELSYNLQFDESEARFRRIAERFPDHPMGYFFLGMSYWSRFIVDYDDRESYDRCLELLDRAVEVGKKIIERSEADAWDYFYVGGAEGFNGQIRLGQGQYLSAYLRGLRGKNYLEKALEMDPGLVDAKLGLGIYHYYAATLPRFIRFFAQLLLMGGDRDQGLAELNQVLDEGRYTRHHARMVLQIVYTDYERENGKALALIEENRRLFPDNHWYDIYLEKVLINMGEYDRAIPLQAGFLRSCLEGKRYFKREWVPHIRFRMGVCYFRLGRLAEARKLFRTVVDDSPEFPKWVVPWSRIQLGMIFDLQGNRGAARTEYNRVLNGPNEADARDWARGLRQNPYVEGDERQYPLFFWNLDPNNYWGYRELADRTSSAGGGPPGADRGN